jgi:uncharacterized protein (DUF486 family)
LPVIFRTAGLLVLSNIFMTFAWYGHLKILQEVITLAVFVPFAVLYMKQELRLDFLWAGLCIMGAVYFIFRGHVSPV